MVRIPSAAVERMLAHATAAFPEECCGILVGRRHGDIVQVTQTIKADNITEGDRRTSYQIDWRSLFTAFRSTRDGPGEVVGFYHSHPDGSCEPSARDDAEAWPGYCYLIAPVSNGRCSEVRGWFTPESVGRAGFCPVSIDIHPSNRGG